MIKSMDLSKFIGKEVHITLRNGEEYVTIIKKHGAHTNTLYSYYFVHPCGHSLGYTESGIHDLNTISERSPLDIIKIEHHNVKHTMTEPLKDETMRTMVRCLTPEAIRYIEGHEKYAEMIFSLFDEFLNEKIGEVNEQVKGDMSCFFMDGISIKAV